MVGAFIEIVMEVVMELVRVQDSDYRKTYELYMTFPENENGYINSVYGYNYEQFLEWIEKKKNWSLGKELPEGFVPDTTYVLVDEGVYVGVFNLRHYLNDALREGAGHIGYCMSKEYRGKGYATKGLALTLAKARQMGIHEVYMSVNKNNPASLRVQIKNGAYIHHENEEEYFTRINAELITKLYSFQDLKYRKMQISIIPSIDSESIIGVRTPELKSMAKNLLKTGEYKSFLEELPHTYFEENQLHAFIISGMKDLSECLEALEKFLPYVDNWATCDQMSPKIFKKHKEVLLTYIKKWIESNHPYTIRFGVEMLMAHFLDDDFDSVYPEMVSTIRSEEYYVNMMIAWYFATALAKQYESVLPFIEKKRLDDWTHNKAIQKCVESRRITEEHKIYLKSLKVRN